MQLDSTFLKTVLLEQNYITKEDLAEAEKHAADTRGEVIDHLFREGKINQSTLGLAIAEHFKVSYIDLESYPPSDADLARIPEDVALAHRAIFVREKGKEVVIATDQVDSPEIKKEIGKHFPQKKIIVSFAFADQIEEILARYEKELTTRFSEIVDRQGRVAPELFEEIIKDALSHRSSDVHFEPDRTEPIVRFRIDGVLRLAGTIPQEYYESILNRIKIQANLRTDEHFMPQDGAIRFLLEDNKVIDLRVSVIPTINGEKVVIRILAEYVRGLNFTDLGFSDAHAALFERAARMPFGMILVVGPTGSGKTTTLYTLLRRINAPGVNVTTIEDPVEYRMNGTNQMQVNAKTGLTFAKGLRALLRQDPNIVLVGEVRDTETAETAINAALSGHLLLSTFHANDAPTTIPRLLDMEVEPFLLASTLELVVAQRLVRRICDSCRSSYKAPVADLKKSFPEAAHYFKGKSVTLYKGTGCTACNSTGYKGRSAIIEILEMTPEIKEVMTQNPTSKQIRNAAKKGSYIPLFEDGLQKAKTGITTLDEVLRVAVPPERENKE